MIWKSLRALQSLLVLGVICLCGFTGLSQEKGKRKTTAPKAETVDAFLDKASGPFTLQKTITFAKEMSEGKYPNKARLFDAYKIRGVDFIGSPENLEQVRKAGGDPEFVALLKNIAGPYKPPPPVPVTGSVDATCGPAECEISLGKLQPVSTKAGKYLFEKVEAGEVTIFFSKPGYVTASKVIQVQPRTTLPAAVTLEPNAEARAAIAKEWLEKVWKALGSGERGAALQEISATGSASLFDAGGAETHWGITARFSAKSASTIDFATPAGKAAFKMQCDPCRMGKTSGRGKLPIDPEEASILLTQLRRVHLGNMISRLTAPEVRVIYTDMKSSGNRVFALEGNDETYELEVGPSLLISAVVAKSKFGGETYQVIYSDYAKLSEASQYPRRTEFHMMGGKRAVKVEFTGTVSKLS